MAGLVVSLKKGNQTLTNKVKKLEEENFELREEIRRLKIENYELTNALKSKEISHKSREDEMLHFFTNACSKVIDNVINLEYENRGLNNMKCIYCNQDMVVSNKVHDIDDELFRERYFCFECNTLFECTSQSGDMVEENLEDLGHIE